MNLREPGSGLAILAPIVPRGGCASGDVLLTVAGFRVEVVYDGRGSNRWATWDGTKLEFHDPEGSRCERR